MTPEEIVEYLLCEDDVWLIESDRALRDRILPLPREQQIEVVRESEEAWTKAQAGKK